MAKKTRPSISIATQVAVYFESGWLCYLCKKPLVFPLALRQLAELVSRDKPQRKPAYFNLNWRRDSAPLLDELGASIDHVTAFAKGGAHQADNFAAVCSRCNARKSDHTREEYLAAVKVWKVKGKHGEPKSWDGLASVFVALASRSTRPLTATEQSWLRALQDHFATVEAR